MTTIVEKTADGVIYRAAKTYPVPDVDLLTLLFGKSYIFGRPAESASFRFSGTKITSQTPKTVSQKKILKSTSQQQTLISH